MRICRRSVSCLPPLLPPSPEVLVVERELAGVRLHDLLARSRPDVHRGDIRQLIACGEVSVNGEVCLHDRRLRVGDVVMLASPLVPRGQQRPGRSDPDNRGKEAEVAVLAETATVLVVAKPSGMPCADRGKSERSLVGWLQAQRPEDDLRVVHSVDHGTSGCVVLAKGLEASRHFESELRAGSIRETYVALVTGVPANDEQQVDAWLGPDRKRPGKVVTADHARSGFRQAHTTVTVRRRFARHALLELRPGTHRGHQLRVHLASLGHAIVCDDDYGGERLLLSRLKADYKNRPGVVERPLLQRMFLHAERVELVDVDGNRVVADAPLPDELAVALRHVEKYTSTPRT